MMRSEGVLDAGSIPASSTKSVLVAKGERKGPVLRPWDYQYISDGAVKVSTGQDSRVDYWRDDRPNRRKTIKANEDTFEMALAA